MVDERSLDIQFHFTVVKKIPLISIQFQILNESYSFYYDIREGLLSRKYPKFCGGCGIKEGQSRDKDEYDRNRPVRLTVSGERKRFLVCFLLSNIQVCVYCERRRYHTEHWKVADHHSPFYCSLRCQKRVWIRHSAVMHKLADPTPELNPLLAMENYKAWIDRHLTVLRIAVPQSDVGVLEFRLIPDRIWPISHYNPPCPMPRIYEEESPACCSYRHPDFLVGR